MEIIPSSLWANYRVYIRSLDHGSHGSFGLALPLVGPGRDKMVRPERPLRGRASALTRAMPGGPRRRNALLRFRDVLGPFIRLHIYRGFVWLLGS